MRKITQSIFVEQGPANTDTRRLAQYHMYFAKALARPRPLYLQLGINVMAIDQGYLKQSFQAAQQARQTLQTEPASTKPGRLSPTAIQALAHQCSPLKRAHGPGFVVCVYQYLQKRAQRDCSLKECAAGFNMSEATFKRKLKQHQTHFKRLQDQVRLHRCLYLFHIKGYSNERVAEELGFSDLANFRRAFKRWSGMTPALSKSLFAQAEAATAG